MSLLDDGVNVLGSKGTSEPEDTFDPADYNIDAVQDFVNAHPDETAAVLASEQDGENRVTLVAWLKLKIEESGS